MDNNEFQGKVFEYLAQLTQNMTEMRQEMTDIRQEMTDIRQDINSLSNRVTNIEMQLENNISPKIAALFEGWQQHTDQLNRIEEKVSTHEEFIIKRIK